MPLLAVPHHGRIVVSVLEEDSFRGMHTGPSVYTAGTGRDMQVPVSSRLASTTKWPRYFSGVGTVYVLQEVALYGWGSLAAMQKLS